MIRVGVLGYSEGNGHPFSFSAIVNGYDDAGFAAAGWPVIHDYLKAQPPERFGFDGVRVTHAWTQDPALTAKLCAACRIETPCADPSEMLGAVDAVIIARDDWETHIPLAMPFLEKGLFVFVDKPLTLDTAELARFAPYLESGKLMSTSGLRYAAELEPLRTPDGLARLGRVKVVTATVLNELDRYGIHMIEALAGLGAPFDRPTAVTRLDAEHEAYAFTLPDGTLFLLNCLGTVGVKTFRLDFFGDKDRFHIDLHDNFSAFRGTLAAFFATVKTGDPVLSPDETLRVIRLLTTARSLAPGASASLA